MKALLDRFIAWFKDKVLGIDPGTDDGPRPTK